MFGTSAFADAIIKRNSPNRNSSIQNSSIIYSNYDSSYEEASFKSANVLISIWAASPSFAK